MESHGVPVPAAAEERRMAVGRFIRLTRLRMRPRDRNVEAAIGVRSNVAGSSERATVSDRGAGLRDLHGVRAAQGSLTDPRGVPWPKAIAGRRASQEFFISWTLVVCQADDDAIVLAPG